MIWQLPPPPPRFYFLWCPLAVCEPNVSEKFLEFVPDDLYQNVVPDDPPSASEKFLFLYNTRLMFTPYLG